MDIDLSHNIYTDQTLPKDFGTLNDAKLLTPFSLDDPRYAQEMIVSIGDNRESQNWKRKPMSVAQFVALQSTHREDKKKDGLAFVLAEILGSQRKKAAVAACYGVGLDIDVGVPGAVIDAALVKLGHLGIRYTTHSHAKTSSKLLKDRITRWAAKNGLGDVDQDVIVRFLREESRWDEGVIESVEYVGDVQEPEGFMVDLHHIPMPKHRVVLPLAAPFYPTQVAKTHDDGMKKWGQVCYGTAAILGDLPLDRSAIDPSRLFYFPRHAPGEPHETSIVGGDLLDWKSLDLGEAGTTAPEPGAGGTYKSKSTTQEGRDLGRWSIDYAERFQVLDVIKDHADDRIRTPGTHKIDIECPFDEEHSDPGNPEDKGCFAVNAGEGPSPIFTIKCQHDSCSQRTNLDHLGKMIKDQWFDREVLNDDAYNPDLIQNVAAMPETQTKATGRSLCDDIIAEIGALVGEVDDIVIELIVAKTVPLASPAQVARVRRAMKKNPHTNLNLSDFDRIRRMAKRATIPELDGPKKYRVDQQGVKLIEYFGGPGEFDQVDAVEALAQVALAMNDDDGVRYPMITAGGQGVMRMDRDPADRVIFTVLKAEQFRAAMNTKIVTVRIDEDGVTGPRKHLPTDITSTFYNTAHRHLPQTPEILRVPTFMLDGKLLKTDGWHEVLNVYMETGDFTVPPVSQAPTQEEVSTSLAVLTDELLIGFPLLDFNKTGNERRGPAEAAALAMIITPFMRRMIRGHTPLFFVAKPTPGTGGTLLGGISTRLFDGREPTPARHSEHNDAENLKEMLTAVDEGRSTLFFDDVVNFNSRVYKQSITADIIAGRRMGGNTSISRPNTFHWIATGNNPALDAEMIRRTVFVRLNAKTHDIHAIKHDRDLPTWIPQNRARIVHAILTLIQNWIAQDKKPFEARSLASFEAWAKAVGGVLQAAGVNDLLDTMRPAETDFAIAADRKFIRAWLTKFGLDKVVSVPSLVDHAFAIEAEILDGLNELDRRKKLPCRLATTAGVTYNLGSKDKPDLVTVAQAADEDGNLAYKLEAVALRPAQA